MDNQIENRSREKSIKVSPKKSNSNKKEPAVENFITTMTKWADDEGLE